MDTGRNVAALMFSNSAPVGCMVVGRYALEIVSARYRFEPRSYCNHISEVSSSYLEGVLAHTRETSSGSILVACRFGFSRGVRRCTG